MPRQFLPGLRRLLTPQSALLEAKSAGPMGSSYVSMTHAGTTTVWGAENRAAGWDLDRVIQEGYERSIWTFKAVETISKHPGALNIEIGRGGDERQFAETLTDHPLLHVLNVQANPLERAAVFKKRLSAQLLLSKQGAFVEVTRSRAGTITRLDLLPPSRVNPIPDPHGDYLSHFEFTTYDGRIRELDPNRIVWLRDPHPTDPYCGITPLEAAGLSVDLDVKARTYNIAYIDNDARPSGIIGIDVDGLDQREIDRIQQRLAPGAQHAGETVVVGSGPGGLNYVDTSTRPRDMNYQTLSQTAKIEVLAAFGVPESVIGNASERTYANADREEWNFWQHTELPHLALIASAFDLDLEDDWSLRFNTSPVAALEYPRRTRREEARAEWNAGLITVDEYREIAGRLPFNTPQSRALWISPQKAPIPATDQDAAALGMAQGSPAEATPGTQVAGQPSLNARHDSSSDTAVAAVEGARRHSPASSAEDVVTEARSQMHDGYQLAGAAAAAVDEARADHQALPAEGPAVDAVDEARRIETKTLPRVMEFTVGGTAFDRAHAAIGAALGALFARQEGVITARLRSPKTRKGTRFWTADGPSDTRGGNDPMDMERVVGAEKWQDEVIATLTPILTRIARTTAKDAADALGSSVNSGASAGIGAAVLTAATVAADAMRAFHRALEVALDDGQRSDANLSELINIVEERLGEGSTRIIDITAESAATATVNGAADAVAAANEHSIERTWQTRLDDRVRPAHAAVDGQTLPVNEPFEMEGWPVLFPGDPLAPLALTANCRCRLRYRAALR
ncbi:phage portal protein [Streptomyces sp. NPDC090442]|uniref:phage portal protein n=1 Tax=Streptomyces sp. NPDC090442 TaxID=3365962 RepID=UPI00381D82C4